MRGHIVGFVVVVVCWLAVPAYAQPWANGISADDQKRANVLFAEANDLFGRQSHTPALEKYQAALKIWDHPVIRFNMAVTLIRLDRMLDAADAIDGALRFGQAPFDAELYAQVLDYQTLVRGRIGEIEASCSQDGAQVVLDGKRWFACPGTRKVRVLIGEHTVSGEHPTLMARPQRVAVMGGAVAAARIEMLSMDQAFTYEYRWRRWIPWTVLGAGVAVGGFGVLLNIAATDRANEYDQDVASSCAVNGCNLDNPDPNDPGAVALAERLNSKRESAESLNRISNVVLLGATATVITGIVLVILNRPTRVAKVDVTATAGGGTASVGWRF